MYPSAWMTNVTPTSDFDNDYQTNFHDVLANQTLGLTVGLTRVRRRPLPLPLLHGRLDPGALDHLDARAVRPDAADAAPLARAGAAFTLDLHLLFGLMTDMMTQYRDAWILHPAGHRRRAVDLLQRGSLRARGQRLTLGGIRLIGPLTALILWSSYFVVLAVTSGSAGRRPTWLGTSSSRSWPASASPSWWRPVLRPAPGRGRRGPAARGARRRLARTLPEDLRL